MFKKIIKQANKGRDKLLTKSVYKAPAPGPTTPESEDEHVLVEFQGSIVKMVITDKTTDGKFVQIGSSRLSAEWKPVTSVKVVHRFEESKR